LVIARRYETALPATTSFLLTVLNQRQKNVSVAGKGLAELQRPTSRHLAGCIDATFGKLILDITETWRKPEV
jgi:hypothetical protein